LCIILFFFCLFLQAHVLSVKNVDSLPLPLIMATFVCCIQWFIYGYVLGDPFIQVHIFKKAFLSDRILKSVSTGEECTDYKMFIILHFKRPSPPPRVGVNINKFIIRRLHNKELHNCTLHQIVLW